MPDIFHVDPLQKYMALFVGPNGCGKSIAIASFMKYGSIYYFDYDGRMASVANWYKQRGLKEGQLLYDTYGPENVFQAFEKLSEFAKSCPHAAIAIDSFTAVTVSAVTFSLNRRLGKGMSHPEGPKTSKGEMIIPDWDEWNGEAVYVTMLLDLCKQIAAQGTRVIWTAHPVQKMKIEGGGQTGQRQTVKYQTKYAAYGHKSDSLLPIYFNEIYQFYTDWNYQKGIAERICQTQPEGEVAAKTALNIPVKFDWTDKNFCDLLMGYVKEGNEKAFGNNKGEEQNEVTEPNNLPGFKL